LLLANCGAIEIVIAGRTPGRAETLASQVGECASSCFADTELLSSLVPAIKNSSLVIVTAPCYGGVNNVVRACLATGVDYIDILPRQEILAELSDHSGEIQKAGRLFVTHGGVGSGLSSALVRAIQSAHPNCDSFRLGVWVSLKGALRPEEAFDFVDVAAQSAATVYRNGKWEDVSRIRQRRLIDYGSGFGARTSMPFDLTEFHGLGEALGLRELSAYAATPNWRLDVLFRALVKAAYRIKPGLGRRIFANTLLGFARFAAPATGACLNAEAWAADSEERHVVRISHADVLDWTASVLYSFVRQYVAGIFNTVQGVRMMGHIIDPLQVMADTRRCGMEYEEGPR
jgi:hypothetical protein